MIRTAALIWFLGELWARLRSAEGGNGRLSGIAFGGGLVAAAMFLLVDMVNLAGAIRADEDGKIDPGVAATLYDVSGLSIAAAAFALSVLAFATAAVAFRTGVLPRWLAWLEPPVRGRATDSDQLDRGSRRLALGAGGVDLAVRAPPTAGGRAADGARRGLSRRRAAPHAAHERGLDDVCHDPEHPEGRRHDAGLP